MSQPKVLIVDDNGTTRKLFRVALEADGYQVVEAETGAGALAAIADPAIGVVLLDCRLPDVMGPEVARSIHALAPALPIVAVTGWVQADNTMMLDAGFAEVLVKPVVPSRLVDVVRHYLTQAPPSSKKRGKRALVVDDDPIQRKLVQVALTAAGFDVTTAEDGAVAIALAKKNPPEVVLSDVLMPNMDGFEVCRAFRGDPVLSHVPVVLMSAHYLEDEDRELGKRFGASRYVSRGGGLDAVIAEVIASAESATVEETTAPPWDLRDQYVRRVAHQLERQAALSSGYARRASLHATAMSILGSISDALARERDPESALDETLNQCLDAAGLSVGAILLFGQDHRLVLRAEVGVVGEQAWTEHKELLEKALLLGTLVVPSEAAGTDGHELLTKAGIASALVVPIVARDEAFGLLILGSGGADLSGSDGESFSRAVRAVATQLGQALALSRLFSKLVAAEERYRVLFDNARDSIAILNPQGIILEVNRQCEEIMRVSRSVLVGRHISEFTRGDDMKAVVEYDEAVARGGGSVPPAAIRRHDGTVVHVEFSNTVVEVGGETLVLSIGRDVSDRLRLAEQFRHAQKLEAVGRLAGGVAHDMNNVLGVVLTYSQLLQGSLGANDPRREDAMEIEAAAERGASLTRQLLAFSRQQVVQLRVLDLNEIIRGLRRMLQTLIGEDIRLETNFADHALGVRVDAGTFEQVIMNLAVNARDAMPTGGRLTIATEGAGGRVLLRVSDTGTGMDENTQQHLFEPFFTTKETGKGTGLGLAMVFGIVKQCGGEIYVDSALGRGTTFAINLPAAGSVEAEGPKQQGSSGIAGGAETVVVVEDEDALRRAIVRGLSDAGYEVISAASGPAIQEALASHTGPLHLLVTDVVLPIMSGPEIARQLRMKDPRLKVLFMSGYTDTTAYPDVPVGGLAFLQKPFSPQTLATKVRAVLDAAD